MLSKRRAIDPKKKQFAVVTPAAPIPGLANHTYAGQAYPLPLSLYTIPPTGEIALEQFEEWAIARLSILTELEACALRSRTPDETHAHMRPLIEKHMPLHANTSRSQTLAAERARDHYSHFILRLAFASTEELRRRFVRLETALFRLRWRDADTRDKADFARLEAFGWDRVSDEDAAALRPDLLAATGTHRTAAAIGADEATGWYRVRWEDVPDQVESRRVLVRKGLAYVSARDISALVIPEFSRRLESAMEVTARALPQLDEQDRLEPILRHLASGSGSAASFDEGADSLSGLLAGASGNLRHVHPTAANVPQLAKGYFPPCMSQIQAQLERDGHVRHHARFEYTLFLKAVGLSVEECVSFWRASLRTKTADEFKRDYEYNVRHSYGTVGGNAEIRRAGGYSAYSCASLAKNAAGASPADPTCHGCPYRSYRPAALRAMLETSLGLAPAVVKEVERAVAQQRYVVACNRAFEAVHDQFLAGSRNAEGVIDLRAKLGPKEAERFTDQFAHPNEYFRRSFLLRHWESLVQTVAQRPDGPSY